MIQVLVQKDCLCCDQTKDLADCGNEGNVSYGSWGLTHLQKGFPIFEGTRLSLSVRGDTLET